METELFGKKPYHFKKKCAHTEKKEHSKNNGKKKKRKKRKTKLKIDILSALKHCIAISQPFIIYTCFYFLWL